MRHLFIPLMFFIMFFILFWNVRNWNMSTAKKIGLVFLCAFASAAVTAVGVWAFIVVFN